MIEMKAAAAMRTQEERIEAALRLIFTHYGIEPYLAHHRVLHVIDDPHRGITSRGLMVDGVLVWSGGWRAALDTDPASFDVRAIPASMTWEERVEPGCPPALAVRFRELWESA